MAWGRWEITQECRKQQLPGRQRDWASRLKLACRNTFTQNTKRRLKQKQRAKKKRSLKKCIRIICLWGDAESTRAISSEKHAREISSRKVCSKAGTDLGDSEGLPCSGVEERGKISSSSQEENTWIRYQPNNQGALFVISKRPDWENIHCSLVNKTQ